MTKTKNHPTIGYWVDVTGIKFEENGTSQWIHAMPLGDWKHPVHGLIRFTLDRLQRFTANVNNKVRGQDLDIDFDHKLLRTDAAGWVQKAETRADGLWLLVDWTKEAAEAIKEKKFRYFSPEFVDEWQHPQTGNKIKDVLFGGGITNRPFLKNMIPLNLTEVLANDGDGNDSTGGGMSRALLELAAKGYGIQFTDETSDEDLEKDVTIEAAKAAAAAEVDPNEGGDDNDDDDANGDDNDDGGDGTPPVTDLDKQLSEAAKKDPLVAALLAERTENAKRLAALETAHIKSENTRRLTELRTGKRQLSPAVERKLSEATEKMSPQEASKVFDAVKTMLGDGGIVTLGERGRIGDGTDGGGDNELDAAAEFTKLVEKKLNEANKKGEKLDYIDAVDAVAKENVELYETYRADPRFVL